MRAVSALSAKLIPFFVLLSIIAVVTPVLAQEQLNPAVGRPLITEPIDESLLTTLKGNTHPLARPQFDLGTADGSLPMKRMLLVLKRSDEQEAALRKLLDNQQDKHSPSYHKWLTPKKFGQQFGPTDADMQTITSWLQSHGFEVGSTKGRTVLEFSGTAAQVEEAFHTTIHKYLVNGEQHWANSNDPQIPTTLNNAVAGISSLNNFPRRAMNIRAGVATRDKATGKIHVEGSQDTWPQGCIQSLTNSNYCNNWVAPYDFATIYDVLPLWTAGINGTGQTIAIVGESNINIQDVTDFRRSFGLPVNNPTVILNGPDPGLQPDETEADLDVQWSGAVAPNATIDFVVSQSTETTTGTDLSAVYIIENNLAPVMSESYGECELGLGTSGNQFYSALWQQAAAQGITVLIAAGDNGAAGCDSFNSPSPAPAVFGLQVSGYASTPYNVAVGGTDFNQFTNPGTYWSTTNNPTTQASALSYIPETTWNDSCTNALWVTLNWGSTAEAVCNNSRLNDVVPAGGSGGSSHCTTPSGSTPSTCAGGYTKPSWQIGAGIPPDGKRDLPDVSLFASNGFLGSAYIICEADQSGPCPSTILGIGGTSASSPAFAGIMALVNQQYGRQGNANYVLYKLAAQQPTAFHDVNNGTVAMPCATGSTDCVTNTAGDAYGVLSGYNSTAGYDLATGLGSVDANNLVTKWNSVTLLPSTTTLSSLNPTTITHGQAVNFTASVAPKSGTGTPTGQISLEGGPTSTTSGIAAFNLTNGSVSGSTEMLPGGTYSVIAHYPGDSTYGPSDSAPTSVTVNKENSQPQAFLVTFDSNGNVINGNTNTAVYGSPYILRVNVNNAGGKLCSPMGGSSATACPTGDVNLTDNGNPLDLGTYALNSYGYVEDRAVQLPGGSNSIQAAYAGDDSFNPSAASASITITPAATTTALCCSYNNYRVGQALVATATVTPTGTGVLPTGSVSFYDNGTLLGTASLAGQAITSFDTYPTTSGAHNITATYGGDANYSGSTSAPIDAYFYYPTVTTLTPSTLNPLSGASITLTALADTSVKTPSPTGKFDFIGVSGTLGTVTVTALTDSSGNTALQGTVSYTPRYNTETLQARYDGDPNFGISASSQIQVRVAGTDFMFYGEGGTLTVAPGQSGEDNFTVDTQLNFAGTITFACSGLPAASSCSFQPNSLTGSGPVSTFVKTTAAAKSQLRTSASNRGWWTGAAMILVGGVLLAVPRKRRPTLVVTVILLSVAVALPSCGGGSSSGGTGGGGGGGNSGTPAGTYNVTVTATSGSLSHSGSIALVVQ